MGYFIQEYLKYKNDNRIIIVENMLSMQAEKSSSGQITSACMLNIFNIFSIIFILFLFLYLKWFKIEPFMLEKF